MRAARVALIGVGVAGTLVGAWLLMTTVRPVGLLGLGLWLAAAVVLHDAILSPVVFVAGWVLRLAGRRLPLAAIAVVQVTAIVGAIGTMLLLPAIRAKQDQRNPSVVPLDYVANLAGLWVALAAASAVGIVVALVVERRRGSRRPPVVLGAG